MTHSIPEWNSVTLIGKIAWGQTGPMALIDSGKCRGIINMSIWLISHVFVPRTSRRPQNRQISHFRYVLGKSRSVTSDYLWKVTMQCQRSDVVICLPKSSISLPFHPCPWQQVTWLKTRSPWKNGRRLYLLWRHSSVTWPDPVKPFLPKISQRKSHKLCKMSAWSAQCGGSVAVWTKKKTHAGSHHPHPPPPSRRGLIHLHQKLPWPDLKHCIWCHLS